MVNGKLDQVEVNTSLLVNVNASINKGFNDTVNALNILTQVNIDAVKLLYYQTQQADTMICILDQISRTPAKSSTRSRYRLGCKRAYARIWMRFFTSRNLQILRQRLIPSGTLNSKLKSSECCPPEPPVPACNYEPCERPKPIEEPKLPRIDGKKDNQPPG